MAFNAGSVKTSLELDIKKFQKEIRKAIKDVEKLAKEAKEVESKSKGMGSGLKKMAAGAAVAAVGILAVRAGVKKFVGVIRDASGAQQEYENSVQALSAALITQGAPAIAETTKEMEAFASTIQNTTDIADTAVLGTAQALVAFGDAADTEKLKAHTKAVLDTAKALNLDAKTAARAFGQALAGNAATLGRYIPSLRGMTQEQLKAGIAFDKAAESFGGFSELMSQTTAGSIARMSNALNDLKKRFGAAFNEFLGPIAVKMQEVFNGFTARLAEGTEGFERLLDVTGRGFEAIQSGIRFVIENVLRLKIAWDSIGVSLAWVQQAFVFLFASVFEGVAGLQAKIQEIIAGVANFIAAIPGLSQGVKDAVQGVADFFTKTAQNNKATVATMKLMKQGAAEVVAERQKALKASQDTLTAIQNNLTTENELVNAINRGLNAQIRLTGEAKAEAAAERQKIADKIRANKLAAKNLEMLRARIERMSAITGIESTAARLARETEAATNGIANAAGMAAGKVGAMADEFGRAADSAERAQAAGRGLGMGGGGGGGTDDRSPSEMRQTASRTSLDFSDPFRAIALAQQAESTLGRISSGGKSVWLGGSQIAASRHALDSIKAEAEQSIARALSEFTGTVLQELNSAGVMDPAERSRIVRERIAEAQRLGVIPDESALETGAGVLQ